MKENLAKIVDRATESLSVVKEIVGACSEAKGRDIKVLDVAKNFGLSDFFIVVSGRSDRQVQGIANRISQSLENLSIKPLSIEGYEDGQWVLIDCGDVVVHVFYEPMRTYYDIESLWAHSDKVKIVQPQAMQHLQVA